MASAQPLPSPVSQRPKSRTISLGSCSGRAKSLRIPLRPVEPPVPPSLLAKASYLTSPHSIFRRALSTPHLPSQEDEEWLRDTVPLSWERRDVNITLGSGTSLLSGMVVLVRTTDEPSIRVRGKSLERCDVEQDTANPMSSPPLVRRHSFKTTVPACTANWFQRTACIAPPSYNTTGCWPWHG